MQGQSVAGQHASQTSTLRSSQGGPTQSATPVAAATGHSPAPSQLGHGQHASQNVAAGQQAAPAQAQDQASSSVNIAILDSQDFPSEVAPAQELYSEFAMADGRVLFECTALVKSTGIDLMNCPLNMILKLRVRRRASAGAMVLWHVVLPLPIISKYLLSPPYEWETWIGLFPNTQMLEALPPDQMFTQAVHLISRPEFPKLRLRFTYHNRALQEKLSAQREMQEQETQRRREVTQKMGRAQFEEIQKLTRTARSAGSPSEHDTPPRQSSNASAAAIVPGQIGSMSGSSQQIDCATVAVTVPNEEERLREALFSALRFTQGVQQMVAQPTNNGPAGAHAPPPPPPLNTMEVMSSSSPASLIDPYCEQLRRCLLHQHSSAPSPGSQLTGPCGGREVESMLTEGLRMALMGMLQESDSTAIPRTATNLSDESSDQLMSIRGRFPTLWDAYREVSAVAKDRARLLEEVTSFAKERATLVEQQRRLQEHVNALRQESAEHEQQRTSSEASQQAETKKQFEKLLAQQRQALQLGFDTEMRELKQKLEETKRSLKDCDKEAANTRTQFGDQQRQKRI